MKNIRIILAIAVIMCFCACGSQMKTEKTVVSSTETTASKKIEGFKSYENEWYSIQYPEDWAFYLTSDSSTLATIESYHHSIYLNQYDSTNVLNLMKIQIVDAGISLLELTEELKDEYDTVYLKKINDQPCCVSL
ncbi:MAG: hypothetical protein J6P44_02660 [Bacteroidales bacterium]|nr:hypothetical protein [Bacteroidales bacterium]